jgi:hypothetical protein
MAGSTCFRMAASAAVMSDVDTWRCDDSSETRGCDRACGNGGGRGGGAGLEPSAQPLREAGQGGGASPRRPPCSPCGNVQWKTPL